MKLRQKKRKPQSTNIYAWDLSYDSINQRSFAEHKGKKKVKEKDRKTKKKK